MNICWIFSGVFSMRNKSALRNISWLGLLAFIMAGCAGKPILVDNGYFRGQRDALYQLVGWSFDGRVAVRRGDESWTATISWVRRLADEKIRLSGPLGQGGVAIRITRDFVAVDRGDGEIVYRDNSDAFVTDELGFYVPLRSLRYWVVGLADPDAAFEDIDNGFIQNDWTVLFRQMQQTGTGIMPRKIEVSNGNVRLKLIIDQWREYE